MTSPGNSPAESTRAGAACPGGPGLIAGRTVARVGYGAMQLRNLRQDRDAAIAILRRAVELGVNHVDTAQFYGDGLVNEFIREAVGADDGVLQGIYPGGAVVWDTRSVRAPTPSG